MSKQGVISNMSINRPATKVAVFLTLVMSLVFTTSIAVACSRWDEPLGRTSLEASSRGCATIISNRGGLPETTNHGIILNELTVQNVFLKLELLIKNTKFS